MRSAAGLAFILLLAGCQAPPHTLIVSADRSISRAIATLNGESTIMTVNGNVASARFDVSDASGRIDLGFSDGTQAACVIGYITNGEFEPHNFRITDGRCEDK